MPCVDFLKLNLNITNNCYTANYYIAKIRKHKSSSRKWKLVKNKNSETLGSILKWIHSYITRQQKDLILYFWGFYLSTRWWENGREMLTFCTFEQRFLISWLISKNLALLPKFLCIHFVTTKVWDVKQL